MIIKIFSGTKIYAAPARAGMDVSCFAVTLQIGQWIDWDSHLASLDIKLIKARSRLHGRWSRYHTEQ